ncbi:hypothetical protein HZY86_01735 [Aerococcaceae bacterium DSM 111020]|nr:hypothetical protein [Aerococcaceae bacterium DSM 111020]
MKKLLLLSLSVGLLFGPIDAVSANTENFFVNDAMIEELENENLINTRNFSENSDSKVDIKGDTVTVDVQNENGGLIIDASTLEPRTSYVMTFKYRKTDGYLNSFGGHTDGIWEDNVVYLDGKKTSEFSDNKSAFRADDEEVHEVVIRFTTPRDESPKSRLIIQPNRGDFDTVTVEMTDFYLVEEEVFDALHEETEATSESNESESESAESSSESSNN